MTTQQAVLPVAVATVLAILALALAPGTDPTLVSGVHALVLVAAVVHATRHGGREPRPAVVLVGGAVALLGIADLLGAVGAADGGGTGHAVWMLLRVVAYLTAVATLGGVLRAIGGWREVLDGLVDGLALAAATAVLLWIPVMSTLSMGPPAHLLADVVILGAWLRIAFTRIDAAPLVVGVVSVGLLVGVAASVIGVTDGGATTTRLAMVLARGCIVAGVVLPTSERLFVHDERAPQLGRLGVIVASLVVLGLGAAWQLGRGDRTTLLALAPLAVVAFALYRVVRTTLHQVELSRRVADAAERDEGTGLRNERWARAHLRVLEDQPALLVALRDVAALDDAMTMAELDAFVLAAEARVREELDQVVETARVERGALLVLLAAGACPAEAAARVVAAFGRPLHGPRGPVRAAVNVAHGHVAGSEALAELAHALTTAARLGSGATVAVSRELTLAAERRSELVRGLPAAVGRRELELRYQPIVDLHTGRVAAAEALLRWHRGHRRVAPDEFVPVAEASGAIVEIGTWVIEEACRRLSGLGDAAVLPLGIHVNVSVRQLEQDDFTDVVARILDRARVLPRRLTVEVTEHVLAHEPDVVLDQLARLARLGVRVAIDDFGTGYSSLAYLARMPVDIIKVDRTFAPDAIAGPQGRLAAGVFRLVRGVAPVVIAEGIETRAQHDAARRLGATHGQGWLLGQPTHLHTLVHDARLVAARA